MTSPLAPIELTGTDDRLTGEATPLPEGFVALLASSCDTVTDVAETAEASRDWWPLALHWALDGTVPRLIKDGAYREFFMHRTGHWLGMDVHDVGDYKVGDEWRLFESGMVTTVEPGIYIPANRKIRARWRNTGIRIEDDVAVTSSGPDVLSKGLVKDPDDIEALMQH